MVRSILKSKFIMKTSVLSLLLIAYFIATIFNSNFWGNILSPMNAFGIAGILYLSYLKTDHTSKVSVSLLLYAVACAFWGIGDIIWAWISFTGGVPEDSAVSWISYAQTNFFFAISLINFLVQAVPQMGPCSIWN